MTHVGETKYLFMVDPIYMVNFLSILEHDEAMHVLLSVSIFGLTTKLEYRINVDRQVHTTW